MPQAECITQQQVQSLSLLRVVKQETHNSQHGLAGGGKHEGFSSHEATEIAPHSGRSLLRLLC